MFWLNVCVSRLHYFVAAYRSLMLCLVHIQWFTGWWRIRLSLSNARFMVIFMLHFAHWYPESGLGFFFLPKWRLDKLCCCSYVLRLCVLVQNVFNNEKIIFFQVFLRFLNVKNFFNPFLLRKKFSRQFLYSFLLTEVASIYVNSMHSIHSIFTEFMEIRSIEQMYQI